MLSLKRLRINKGSFCFDYSRTLRFVVSDRFLVLILGVFLFSFLSCSESVFVFSLNGYLVLFVGSDFSQVFSSW